MPSSRQDLLRRFGAEVRAERKRQGLSQEALALEADIDRGYMGNVERGEENISLASILKLTMVLKVKPSVLLDRAGY
jgi:transcriptional regulator with XRE-family HTH domain